MSEACLLRRTQSCRVQWHVWNVLPASTCLPWPSFKFEYFRRKDGRLCRHVKLQTAESPNAWHFPSFKLLFAVSYYLHTSFKLVSNSSFKVAVKGELHFFWELFLRRQVLAIKRLHQASRMQWQLFTQRQQTKLAKSFPSHRHGRDTATNGDDDSTAPKSKTQHANSNFKP